MTSPRKLAKLSVAVVLAAALPARTAEFDLFWFTLDGGGGYSAGGVFEVEGTIGQPDADVLTGGAFTLRGGFWPAATGAPVRPGDCDGNGLVTLADFSNYSACLTGPGQLFPAGCGCHDLDADGDVDLLDFAAFQSSLSL